MPATHLISVDFPAPLSPTSAITSPSRTSKSTACSACTDPKLFETPRSSRVARGVAFTSGFYHDGGAPRSASVVKVFLLAVLRVDAVTDLALLQESVREELRVVRLGDPDRLQQDRLRAADLAVDAGYRLAVDDRDRSCCGRVGLEANGLVDRARLPAGEDELDASRRRVLSGQRDRLQAVCLQGRDHRAGKTVVRGKDAVDLVAVASEHLVEDRPSLRRAPLGVLVTGRCLLERAALEERVQDRVVTLLEQDGVVVLDVPVQLGDHRVLRVRPLRLEAGDETLTLELAHRHVVERDVVRGLALDDEAVVVDHFRPASNSQAGDRGARGRIELVEQD